MVLVWGIFTRDNRNGSYIQIYDSKHPLVFQNRIIVVPVDEVEVYLWDPNDCETQADKYIYKDDEELPF